MKKLVIATLVFQMIAFVAHSQPPSGQNSKDSINVAVPDAINSLRVHDSLTVMKRERDSIARALYFYQFLDRRSEQAIAWADSAIKYQKLLVENKTQQVNNVTMQNSNVQKAFDQFKEETRIKIKNKNRTIVKICGVSVTIISGLTYLLMKK